MRPSVILLSLGLLAVAPANAHIIEVIAVTGDSAPDGDGTFIQLNAASLNDAGLVAFTANLTGTSNDNGLFRSDETGGFVQISRKNDAAPGGSGAFNGFFPPALNESGQVAARGSIDLFNGGDINDLFGVFRGDGDNPIERIARGPDAAPDGNGTFFFFNTLPELNDAGQTAFRGGLIGTSGGAADNNGIYRGDDPGVLVQIARLGDAAPDGNGTFSFLNDTPALNAVGQVAFAANLVGTSGGPNDDNGVYRGDGSAGNLVEIVREGQSVPDGNGVFSSIGWRGGSTTRGRSRFRRRWLGPPTTKASF